MTQYWDLTCSSDYQPDDVFVGRYYGDVLDDDAFACTERPVGDEAEVESDSLTA